MSKFREVVKVLSSQPAMEGAGVSLQRVFGFTEQGQFDPFLLLDHFGSDNPNDYLAGFPWHPHRGIETVTYMLEGVVEHGDSLGNKGTIQSGDIQWMTAGSGIIHQEMPKAYEGVMQGFQLWVNLPAEKKMMTPRYQDVKASSVPEVALDKGIQAKVICGTVQGVSGPVRDIVVENEYLDITVPAETSFEYELKEGYNTFVYVFEGAGLVCNKKITQNQAALLSDSGSISVITTTQPIRFLLISGKPLNEPIAWRGPIVMNTQEEIHLAFEEYHGGSFIK